MTTQHLQAPPERGALLRWTLRGNVAFSLLSGSYFLVGSRTVADFLGLTRIAGVSASMFLAVLGLLLIGFAAYVWYVAHQQPFRRNLVWSVIGLDAVWVVGSYLLLLSRALPLTFGGAWSVFIVAEIVFVFAVLQFFGLRRLD